MIRPGREHFASYIKYREIVILEVRCNNECGKHQLMNEITSLNNSVPWFRNVEEDDWGNVESCKVL